MKQCPNCKKNIPDDAKVCPHCGTRLEKTYKPMKRRKGIPNSLYLILALVIMFMPSFLILMFSEDINSDSLIPSEEITVGPLGTVDINKEEIENQYTSLKDFKEKVKNSDTYVTKIETFEKNLNDVVNKYASSTIATTNQFYVTNENNIYTTSTYNIKVGDFQTMKITLSYDLSGKTNTVNIRYNINNFTSFATMKYNDDSYPMYKEIIQLITGSDDLSALQETGNSFNELESKFNELSKNLGNYGLGVNKSVNDVTSSMRVTDGQDNTYRLTITHKGKLKLDLFV